MDGPWRSWKEGCNDPPEKLADGFPPPFNWRLRMWLDWLYATAIVEETRIDE